MKIVILDDESLDLFVAKKLLGLEFQAEGFTTIPEFIAWAKDNHFDVALIDYYLTPTVLAPDVLKELHTVKRDKFKAFVLSNYVDDNQVKQLKAVGFDGVIYKPLTLENFKQQINHH
ncbi:MAG TPA: response regulator [Ohtaekwangia sp.]